MVNKKKHILAPVTSFIDKTKEVPFIKEYTDMFRIARHPEDGFYDLKTKKKGSFRASVAILFTLFVVLYTIYFIFTPCG